MYCITRGLFYVSGFTQGYITWDDEDIGNRNDHGGALPDGTYDSNTRIYYCCRQVTHASCLNMLY